MPTQEAFIGLFREAQVNFSQFYDRILSKADITLSQYALLSQLSLAGTIKMTEASKFLHVSKPAITNLVDRLEEKKMLKRIPHHEDRRIYLLQISAPGQKIVKTIQSNVLKLVLSALGKFKGSEQAIIREFYSELSKTVQNKVTHDSE